MILASGASLAWGSSDFLAGLGARRLGVLAVLFASQLIGLFFLLPVLMLSGKAAPALSGCALAVLAGGFNAVALAAFYRALARGPIGLVAPIAAGEAIIPVMFGLLEGNRPSGAAMLGITLALIGVILAAEPAVEHDEAGQRKSRAPGVMWAILAAIGFGFFVVTFKSAAGGGALWAVTLSRASTVVLLAVVFVVSRARSGVRRRHLAFLAAVGTLDLCASTLFAFAARQTELSVIGVLGSFYPVVTVLLAGIFLRERMGSLQRVGAVGALAGVALITVG